MTVRQEPAGHGATRFGVRRVHRDAGAAAVASVANAVLGAAFWAFAARFIPPHELGVMTAVLAVIVATASVMATGVGDAYTALLPAVGTSRPRVYRRGQRVFFTLVVLAAVAAAAATTALLDGVKGSASVTVLVAVGVVAVATFNLQTSTIMAIGRASWVPAANVVLGLGKMAVLPFTAFVVGWHSVELAVVIATLALAIFLRQRINRIITEGDQLCQTATISEDEAPREFDRMVLQTTTLSALGLGVVTLTPFLVTMFAGPRQGALFALTFSVVATLGYIAAAMAVSLVVHASSAPEHAWSMARSLLLRAVIVTVIGTSALVLAFPAVLRIVNPEYADMNVLGVVAALCAATAVRVAYIVWAALQQSRRKLRMPILFNAISAAVMLAVMPGVCGAYGAAGGALAVLIHQMFLTGAAAIHVLTTTRHGRTTRHV